MFMTSLGEIALCCPRPPGPFTRNAMEPLALTTDAVQIGSTYRLHVHSASCTQTDAPGRRGQRDAKLRR